jgi:hypothetical protein
MLSPRSAQTLRKDAASAATMNSSVFLQITEGSASELDCYFLLARDLGFLPKADYLALADDLAALRKC